MKLVDIKQETNGKFLKMYTVIYEHEGKIINWSMSSRKNIDELREFLSNKGKQTTADTVCVVPFIANENGDDCLIFIKEFRQPINDYVYSFPAGLVEKGENPIHSAIRELNEEIGAEEIQSIVPLMSSPSFNSEGMTDESVIMYQAVISKLGEQNLQDAEDIKVCVVPLVNLEEFMQDKHFSTKAAVYAGTLLTMYKQFGLLNANEVVEEPTGFGPQSE